MIAAYIDCRHVTIMATGSVVFHGSLDDLHALAPEAEFMLTTRDPERVLAVCRAQPQITAARAEGPVVHFMRPRMRWSASLSSSAAKASASARRRETDPLRSDRPK